jgi:hypothetical protein
MVDDASILAVVGLFGAIEVQHINGPLFAETEFTFGAELVAFTAEC